MDVFFIFHHLRDIFVQDFSTLERDKEKDKIVEESAENASSENATTTDNSTADDTNTDKENQIEVVVENQV